jgi:hypothetical protein
MAAVVSSGYPIVGNSSARRPARGRAGRRRACVPEPGQSGLPEAAPPKPATNTKAGTLPRCLPRGRGLAAFAVAASPTPATPANAAARSTPRRVCPVSFNPMRPFDPTGTARRQRQRWPAAPTRGSGHATFVGSCGTKVSCCEPGADCAGTVTRVRRHRRIANVANSAPQDSQDRGIDMDPCRV